MQNDVHQCFITNGLTLSLAESCTGGGISARIVEMPDCSHYFLGSIVSYSGVIKEKLLGVSHRTIASFGEVSAETAVEMASGALKSFDTDIALSVTGIAGPTGGNEKKPIGTVFFAIASKKKSPVFWYHKFSGSRSEIISQCIDTALIHLGKYVNS